MKRTFEQFTPEELSAKFSASIKALKKIKDLEAFEAEVKEIERYLAESMVHDTVRLPVAADVRMRLEEERKAAIVNHRDELEIVRFSHGQPLAIQYIKDVRAETARANETIEKQYQDILKNLDEFVDKVDQIANYSLSLQAATEKFSSIKMRYSVDGGCPYVAGVPWLTPAQFKAAFSKDVQPHKEMSKIILTQFLAVKELGKKTQEIQPVYEPFDPGDYE